MLQIDTLITIDMLGTSSIIDITRAGGNEMKEYQISKGNRDDRDGALVVHGTLITLYDSNAAWIGGDMVALPYEAEVVEAAKRVIETGEPETITVGVEPIGNISVGEVARHIDRMGRMMDAGEPNYR
jgi:hypothetical protein